MKNKRPGTIFPIIIVAFLITIILFTAGGMYIGNNARMINTVKDQADYKTVLSNFHELSYAKITEIASSTQNFDGIYDNSNPSEGFGTFINNFETQLNDSVFTDQWSAVTSKMDAGSDHRLILSYTESATTGNALVETFAMYVDDLSFNEDIAKCESVLIKLDGTDYKSLLVCKLELSDAKNNQKMFSAALIQKAHYSQQYFYFTEQEKFLDPYGNYQPIWFTDGEIIDGPVGSMDTINISGNPVFKGTVFYNPEKGVELPGFNLDDDNPNSNGVFLGDPAKTPLPTDTSFATLSNNYKKKIETDFVSFSTIHDSIDGNIFTRENISAGGDSFTRFQVENIPEGLNSLEIKISGNNGDADLYVAMNREPTKDDNDGSSTGSNSRETVRILNPTAGTLNILIFGCDYYSGRQHISGYINLDLSVIAEPSIYSPFYYNSYEAYLNAVPVDQQIDFITSQSLKLDYNPSDYYIDFNNNSIKIDWKDSNDFLVITFKEKQNVENMYEATYTYSDGDETYTTSGIPFSGFISTVDQKIYLGDHDNSNGGNICYYNGKITLQTTNKIYIEDHVIPKALNDASEFSLEPNAIWTEEKNALVKDYMKNNVDASLSLITDDYIYIGTADENSEHNQKLFATMISFNGKIQVYDHDAFNQGEKGQLSIFGTMMQKQRGAVGNSVTLIYNDQHFEYSISGNRLYYRDIYRGSNGIFYWTNWNLLYTLPQSVRLQNGSYIYNVRSIYKQDIENNYYFDEENDMFVSDSHAHLYLISGFTKNYHFDPRFSDGFTLGTGNLESKGIDVIMSGLIEVY